MKARITNHSGFRLEIPAQGFAPMLFMEYFSIIQDKIKKPVTIRISRGFVDVIHGDESPVFYIRLKYISGTDVDYSVLEDFRDYINANLESHD